MYQRIYLSLLVSVGFLFNAAGQPDTSAPNPVAFGMIRATTKFLATDTKAFGNRATIPCSPCETYDDLTRYVTQNRLMGADKLIIDARNEANRALQTDSTQMPATLRSFLLNRVTGGSHGYRTELQAYNAYARALGAPIITIGEQSTEAANVPESGDLTPVIGPTDTTTATTEALPSDSPDQTLNAFSVMDYLPLILSVLSIAGVIVLWFRKPVSPSRAKSMILPEEQQLNRLTERISKLENDNDALRKKIESLQQSVDAPRAPASQPQSANRPVTQVTPPAPPVHPAPQPVPPPSTPSVPVAPQIVTPTLFFGRTADLGDGFSAHNLSDKPDRDTVFEILRTDPARAEFKVSDNPDLQRLALSDAYSYLNDTCTYTTQPRPGNRIRTEKPGLLSLQGEKWVIVEKAQISFLG